MPWYKFPCHPGTPTEKPSMASVLGATVADLADMADFLDVLDQHEEESAAAQEEVARGGCASVAAPVGIKECSGHFKDLGPAHSIK